MRANKYFNEALTWLVDVRPDIFSKEDLPQNRLLLAIGFALLAIVKAIYDVGRRGHCLNDRIEVNRYGFNPAQIVCDCVMGDPSVLDPNDGNCYKVGIVLAGSLQCGDYDVLLEGPEAVEYIKIVSGIPF
jgi:hypothetical protein